MTVPRIFELDGRTSIAKDVRARFDALVNDLGGLDSLNYGHRILAERAVWLEYLLATQERDRVAGKVLKRETLRRLDLASAAVKT